MGESETGRIKIMGKRIKDRVFEGAEKITRNIKKIMRPLRELKYIIEWIISGTLIFGGGEVLHRTTDVTSLEGMILVLGFTALYLASKAIQSKR